MIEPDELGKALVTSLGSVINIAVANATAALHERVRRLEADNVAGIQHLENVARKVMEPVVDRLSILEHKEKVYDEELDAVVRTAVSRLDFGDIDSFNAAVFSLFREDEFADEVEKCFKHSAEFTEAVKGIVSECDLEDQVKEALSDVTLELRIR